MGPQSFFGYILPLIILAIFALVSRKLLIIEFDFDEPKLIPRWFNFLLLLIAICPILNWIGVLALIIAIIFGSADSWLFLRFPEGKFSKWFFGTDIDEKKNI